MQVGREYFLISRSNLVILLSEECYLIIRYAASVPQVVWHTACVRTRETHNISVVVCSSVQGLIQPPRIEIIAITIGHINLGVLPRDVVTPCIIYRPSNAKDTAVSRVAKHTEPRPAFYVSATGQKLNDLVRITRAIFKGTPKNGCLLV